MVVTVQSYKAEEKLTIDGHEMSYEVWRKNCIAQSQNVIRGYKWQMNQIRELFWS